MRRIPLSLQMWTIRDVMDADFRAAIEAVAEMGYAGVELAGYGNLNAHEAAAAIRDAGLDVSGMHVIIERLRSDWQAVAEEAALLGTSHITCPYIDPKDVATRAQCEALGEELNRIGAQFTSHGLRFSYHHHGHEIAHIEGKSALDWILGATEPRFVEAQLDVYWVYSAGQKPADFIYRFGSRVPLIHLKDGFADGRQCEIGRGEVDFDAIFAAVEQIDVVEWFIVEQEQFDDSSLKSAKMCLNTLKKWGRF